MSGMENRAVVEISHVSAVGSSFRITLPKKIVNMLDLSDDDNIVIFYKEENGSITLERLKDP